MEKSKEKKKGDAKKTKDSVTLDKTEYDTLKQDARNGTESHDKMLRAYAELENTKKRLHKEKDEFVRFANEGLILRLLPIVDNFDRALASVKHTEETDAVLSGIRMVQKELHSLFKDHGVEEVEAVGRKFDPHFHEAIAVVETDDHPDDTVLEEIQRGYTLNGRLMRPSIVKVSKKRD
jgi:molecular chaperone GrpE